MKKTIVVSHYRENVEWLLDIESNVKIYLYTKGNMDLSKFRNIENIEIIELENVGKEQHTYFYHIVKNYNHLDGIIYFVQDNPFDHSVNFYQKLNANFIGPLSDFNLITSIYGYPDTNQYKKHLNHKYDGISPEQILGNIFIDPWNDADESQKGGHYNMDYIIDQLPELHIKKENWIYNANGLYSTTGERIRELDISTYKKCIDLFKDPYLDMAEYAFERINRFIILR